MSLSFNEEHGVVLWGSESSALDVPLVHSESLAGHPRSTQLVGELGFEDNEAAPHLDDEERKHGSVNLTGAAMRSHSCTHRYDLDEDGGEIVEVRSTQPGTQALSLAMAHWTASGNVREIFSSSIGDLGGYLHALFLTFLYRSQ